MIQKRKCYDIFSTNQVRIRYWFGYLHTPNNYHFGRSGYPPQCVPCWNCCCSFVGVEKLLQSPPVNGRHPHPGSCLVLRAVVIVVVRAIHWPGQMGHFDNEHLQNNLLWMLNFKPNQVIVSYLPVNGNGTIVSGSVAEPGPNFMAAEMGPPGRYRSDSRLESSSQIGKKLWTYLGRQIFFAWTSVKLDDCSVKLDWCE